MSRLLHGVLEEGLQLGGERIALTEEGGLQLSYAGLEALSNQYAHALLTLKPSPIRSRPYLGVLSPVHAHSLAACLGILKLGGAYVPLDEQSPPARLRQILQSAGLEVVAVDANLLARYQGLLEEVPHLIVLGEERVSGCSAQAPPSLNQVSDDLAYLLHSSGSTGVPKGIMLTHRNARTFVDWMHTEFQMSAQDVVMSRAPLKFDLSVFDLFNSLKAGARLVCFDWNRVRSREERHRDYVRLMREQGASVLYTTPSTFTALLNHGGLEEGVESLRQLMYAGEPFQPAGARRLMRALPQARLANIYGPTETNIITCYWLERPPQDGQPIPLGREVVDTEILVVEELPAPGSSQPPPEEEPSPLSSDQQGLTQSEPHSSRSREGETGESEPSSRFRECETEEVGELWCRGGTVSLGYLGLPEQSARALVQSPFHPYPAWFWRTGDYGFRDRQGLLHYRGRRDHMVKVRGFRIELGEIEAALSRLPQLAEAVIVARPHPEYGSRLYCFYALREGEQLEEGELLAALQERLPAYMLPYRALRLDFLPHTSSGKPDRVELASRLEGEE